jgi:hypothetical protein
MNTDSRVPCEYRFNAMWNVRNVPIRNYLLPKVPPRAGQHATDYAGCYFGEIEPLMKAAQSFELFEFALLQVGRE